MCVVAIVYELGWRFSDQNDLIGAVGPIVFRQQEKGRAQVYVAIAKGDTSGERAAHAVALLPTRLRKNGFIIIGTCGEVHP